MFESTDRTKSCVDGIRAMVQGKISSPKLVIVIMPRSYGIIDTIWQSLGTYLVDVINCSTIRLYSAKRGSREQTLTLTDPVLSYKTAPSLD